MKKMAFWTLLASLVIAVPAAAQSQYQSTFEIGVGYTRPSTENIDMVSFLLQADDFFVETGIGIRTKAGLTATGPGGGDNVISWLVRGAARPFMIGNTTGHVGAEFSLHSNSTLDDNGDPSTLLGFGVFVGVAHQVTDHFNLAVHVFPLSFGFGGKDTVAKIGVAEIGAHILF